MANTLSIADVERDTGLSKDTLRVWERRYGFPRPRRDASGERAYTPAQVEKLRVIKRLLDTGHRPGRLMSRTLGELHALGGAARAMPAGEASRHGEVDALLEMVRRHDTVALLQGLAVAEARHGLRAFVLDITAPLARRVGDAWMQGNLHVFEEHLFTECVQTALRTSLRSLPATTAATPRVLLATLPGDPHGLGLLMAQTVLTLEDCACLSLGVQVPLSDIVAGAKAWRADIVALSVTGCVRRAVLIASLEQLRAQLPAAMALWVGGAATALRHRQIDGVSRVATLESVGDALAPWRAAGS
jgi:MerR family transcriptional regulator, light-induced transcriptional regulator